MQRVGYKGIIKSFANKKCNEWITKEGMCSLVTTYTCTVAIAIHTAGSYH